MSVPTVTKHVDVAGVAPIHAVDNVVPHHNGEETLDTDVQVVDAEGVLRHSVGP